MNPALKDRLQSWQEIGASWFPTPSARRAQAAAAVRHSANCSGRVLFYAPQVEFTDQDNGMQHASIVQPFKARREGRLAIASLRDSIL